MLSLGFLLFFVHLKDLFSTPLDSSRYISDSLKSEIFSLEKKSMKKLEEKKDIFFKAFLKKDHFLNLAGTQEKNKEKNRRI